MHPKLKAWAQLVRIPNTLTACADSLAGFSIAAGHWFQYDRVGLSLVCISLASISLYWAGMVLNDVHDIEADRINRRNGPLVDGRIPLQTASLTGWVLICIGIAFATISAYFVSPTLLKTPMPLWSVGGVAVALALTIVAYDSRWKSSLFGPVLMGLCRGLNLLLGVMLGACWTPVLGAEWIVVSAAVLGHFLFVMGITLAARRESDFKQSSSKLSIGWITSFLGVVSIAACSLLETNRELNLDRRFVFPLLVLLLCGPWIRRAILSIQQPGIATLIPAIKQAILTIIYLDAALTLQFAGNLPGALVCFLAIPTWAMARYFRMT